MKLLKNLLAELPSCQSERFDSSIVFPGLECWLIYLKNSLEEDEKVGQDVVYKNWYQTNIKCEDPLESNIVFSKLFQCLQIRSSSEVSFFMRF